MFGKNARLNSLESQKRLLILESELGRVQVLSEWQPMAESVQGLVDRARTFGSLACAAMALATGMAAFRRHKPVITVNKPSWGGSVLKIARVACSVWDAVREPSR